MIDKTTLEADIGLIQPRRNTRRDLNANFILKPLSFLGEYDKK